ncbi:Stk1 family PASTA domain-containing Ser/Thr kinase [Schaalia sp. Marseille-Q2122]|uniref:Stk1 family PASTA domain-containing Ser/Thr kinase n=1 Tax=Schaalia sp. Marseille-Q2122 TaxID=2736604 RepID=UPI00158B16EA|nr:Stk1 family PASTA domain-containing Ser/Thr kinase [Schaalia sp. Marseille-Q2122]
MVDSMAHHLGGRYEVRSLIGRGGMAEVNLGFDTRLNRIVAIKRLRTDLARDSVFQARFRREAQSAASLNHPNIVAVYDTSEEDVITPDGSTVSVPYIVMEYVEGHTVKDLLSDGTAVPIDEAVEIASGVLSALAYAHTANLVHRDIKPGNIMLTNDGKVKVMDFGIARALTDSQATMTQTNAVVGTAQYLSPEQARGEQVDPRSDLYAVGVLLFELLTGQPPFRGDSAVSVAYQHVSSLPPAPSTLAADVPESLDRVVMKAMAKDPADRYESAAVMRTDLTRAMHGMDVDAPATEVWGAPSEVTATIPMPPPVSAMRARPTETTTAPSFAQVTTPEAPERKKPVALLVSLVVLLVLALVGGGFLLFGGDTPQSDETLVEVPRNLVNMTQDEARRTLEPLGLKFALGGEENSDTVEKGRIIRTSPEGGQSVKPGETIIATISMGPNSVVIPTDILGKSFDEAKKMLEDLGLTAEKDTETVPSDEIEKDKVAKTNPSPGQKVKGGSPVKLTLSSGPDSVNVPDLSNMNQDQARDALTAKGLIVGNVEIIDGPYAKGLIVSSEPAFGESVKKNSTIKLMIASGDVVIPSGLEGRTEDEVVTALTESGLTVDVNYQPNEAAKDIVFATSPKGGQKVPFGPSGRVTIFVSTGPQQQQPSNPGAPGVQTPPSPGANGN